MFIRCLHIWNKKQGNKAGRRRRKSWKEEKLEEKWAAGLTDWAAVLMQISGGTQLSHLPAVISEVPHMQRKSVG